MSHYTRRLVAMGSGVFTMRLHATLNDIDSGTIGWWVVVSLASLGLYIFVSALLGPEDES